ncbi:MAG: DUF445 family protein [Sarcina sp.]
MAYLISAIIGAIIGFFTNWLAIKMLFRPHTEKRVAGIRIPFTPGLIPKEKKRIAKSVAESVGEHLINPESMSKTLNKPEVKEKIKSSICDKVEDTLNKEGTLDVRFKELIGSSYEEKIQGLEDVAYDKIVKVMSSDDNKEKIISYAMDFAKNKLEQEPKFLVEVIKKIDLEPIVEQISNNIASDEGTTFIVEKLDDFIDKLDENDNTLRSYIPDKVYEKIEKVVYDNRENIVAEINILLRSESVSTKFKDVILSKMLGGLGGMVARFINIDNIYDKLVNSVEEYLSEEKNANEVCAKIVEYIDKVAQNKVSYIAKQIPAGLSVDLAVAISTKTTELMRDRKNIDYVKESLISYINGFESYDDLIKKFDSNYIGKLEKVMLEILNTVSESKEIKQSIKTLIEYARNEVLSYEINKDDKVKKQIVISVREIVDLNYDKFIEQDLQNVMELVDIQAIVEDQINEFDVDEGEKIILGIASKELSAITWLGALLGAILGVLSPLISSLYM